MKKLTINKSSLQKFSSGFGSLNRHAATLFVIFVAVLYGTLLVQIQNLLGEEPSKESVSQQIEAAEIPHIDESTVRQLESLRDNSVSVQTLFNEARGNPFQE